MNNIFSWHKTYKKITVLVVGGGGGGGLNSLEMPPVKRGEWGEVGLKVRFSNDSYHLNTSITHNMTHQNLNSVVQYSDVFGNRRSRIRMTTVPDRLLRR